MIHDAVVLVVGGVLLYFGAEWLVRGAAGLAAKVGVRPLVIGLTVVAYGTSAPELVVGVGAAASGRGAIAFGNAVGSNIANLGLILGATAIVAPPRVSGGLLRRELPVMLASAFAVPLLLLDGRIGRLEGVALVACALAYTAWMVRGSRARPTAEIVAAASDVADASRKAAGAPRTESRARLVVFVMIGLAALLGGGKWLVDGASGLARAFGSSERVIGLTVVAVGTSVPELATSLIAARRGHSDIAVGNVIGSNVFNVLLILGASGVAGTVEVPLAEARAELVALVAVSVLAAVFLRTERTVTRLEGGVLVAAYATFMACTLLRS